VLEGTVRVARQRLSGEITLLREELNGLQLRVKNFKSQPARMRQSDSTREAELKEQIGTGEARVAVLKGEVQIRERTRRDEKSATPGLCLISGRKSEFPRLVNASEKPAPPNFSKRMFVLVMPSTG
jgi:hypothetical protein